MERTVEYLRECGVFFVAAADGGRPCVEPVGEAGLFDGAVYISVRRETALYRALKKNAAAEIAAMHPDKSWLSVTGRLAEDCRPEALAAMAESGRDTLSAVCVRDGDRAVFRIEGGRAVMHELIGRTQTWDLP